jgi:hypothetical protein
MNLSFNLINKISGHKAHYSFENKITLRPASYFMRSALARSGRAIFPRKF